MASDPLRDGRAADRFVGALDPSDLGPEPGPAPALLAEKPVDHLAELDSAVCVHDRDDKSAADLAI